MILLLVSACSSGDDEEMQPDAAGPTDNGETTYTEEMIGTPVFRMAEWQHDAGPMGTQPGGAGVDRHAAGGLDEAPGGRGQRPTWSSRAGPP